MPIDIPVEVGLAAMGIIYQCFFFGYKLWNKWWGIVLEVASFGAWALFIYLRFIR